MKNQNSDLKLHLILTENKMESKPLKLISLWQKQTAYTATCMKNSWKTTEWGSEKQTNVIFIRIV